MNRRGRHIAAAKVIAHWSATGIS